MLKLLRRKLIGENCPQQKRVRFTDGNIDDLQRHPDQPLPALPSQLSLPVSRRLAGKDTRAAMVFGRCFEGALCAHSLHQDCTVALFKEWEAFRDTPFEYRKGESWDRLLHQGIHLLEKFVREDRVCVPNPKENLQRKIHRALAGVNDFVSY